MQITVAICTWNRAKLLDDTLRQMRKLRIPPGVKWELLVVNNHCVDATDAVIARHSLDLPIRRLFEPKPGHSNARNCALQSTQGDLLIWTDDDVLVDEGWLEAYWDAYLKWPQAAYFGGTIDPLYEVEPPGWVLKHPELVCGPFALRQLGDEVRELNEDEIPFGASMAFRRSLTRDLSFNPKLGRVGTGLISGDDMAVMETLRSAGMQGIWVGTARVRHWVPKERMTRRYVWDWLVGGGRTMVLEGDVDGPKIFGMPRWAVRRYVESMLCWHIRRLADPRKRAQWWRKWAVSSGVLSESRRMVRARNETSMLAPTTA